MTRSLRAPRAEAGSARVEPDAGPEAPDGPTLPEGLDRFRIVLAAAMGTVIVSYALLVPPALVVVLAGGADVSVDGAFATAIPLWLAAHLIPLDLQGQPLSVLPLLPVLMVVAVVSVGARWAARRLGGRFRHDAGAVVAASAGAHAAVAVLGSALLPNAAEVGAAPWAAMLGAGLVAAIGAGIGVLRVCAPPEAWRERLRGWPAAGLAGAVVGGAALLLAGALVLVVGLLFGASRAHDMFAALTPTGGGALGLLLLCLAYLPNAVVAGASWLLGPGVDVGLGAWTPFGGVPGELPPFPLLAALPPSPSPAWAVVVVVVPVGVGLVVGGICRSTLGPATTGDRLRAVGVATGVLALVAGVVALAAGGRLSAGDFDPVAVPAALVALAVVVWVGGPAAVVALVQRGGAPAASDEDLTWHRVGYSDEHPVVEDDDDETDTADDPQSVAEGLDPADTRDSAGGRRAPGGADRGPEPAGTGSPSDRARGWDAAHHPSSDADSGTAGSDAAGSEAAGPRTTGSEAAGSEVAGSEPAGSGAAGSRTAGSGRAGSAAAGSDVAGSDAADSDAADSGAADDGVGAIDGDGGVDRDGVVDADGVDEGDLHESGEPAAGRRRSAGAGPRGRGGRRADRNAAVDAARRRRDARLARSSGPQAPDLRSGSEEERRAGLGGLLRRRGAREASEVPPSEEVSVERQDTSADPDQSRDQPRRGRRKSHTPDAATDRTARDPMRDDRAQGDRAQGDRAWSGRVQADRVQGERTRSGPARGGRGPGGEGGRRGRPGDEPVDGSAPDNGLPTEAAEPAPRTVAELVALRKRQAEAAAEE